MQEHLSQGFKLVDWQVNPELNQLTIDERVFELEPKVMQVLICLNDHAGELVTKEMLFEEVWNGVSISDDAIYCSIAKLRKTFRQAAENRSPTLKTITRQGYMLCNSPAYQILKPQSFINHGRRHDDKVPIAREKTSEGEELNHSKPESPATSAKKQKRVVRNSELKLLNLTFYVDEQKVSHHTENHRNRNKRLKVLLLILLLVILVQASVILFA